MPNPHFRVSIISRGANQNAVASAAYRAGESLYYDTPEIERSALNAAAYRSGETLAYEQRGQVFSFVRKEGILHKEIYAPADAPTWARDRQALWNEVEKAEDKSTRRATAHLARDFVASLPRELSHEQHRTLVARFVQDNFTRRGLVADVAFHSVKAKDGKQNPHVHMMVATRTIDADGFGKKPVWLEKKAALYGWRQSWEHHTNRMLEAAGTPERLSLQTYKAQGIDKEGRKSLTREAYALEQKGVRTWSGDRNREIAERNAEREARRGTDRELDAQRRRLQPKDGGPLWSDFSARVGSGVDAARDAVHRFRQKEDTMSDDRTAALFQQQQGQPTDGTRPNALFNRATAPTAAPTPAAQRETTAFSTGMQEAQRLAREAGATNHSFSFSNAAARDLGQNTPNPTPREQAAAHTPQRGLMLGGTDSKTEMPPAPAKETGRIGHAPVNLTPANERETKAMAASLSAPQRTDVDRMRAANMSQNHATKEQEQQRSSIFNKGPNAGADNSIQQRAKQQGLERDGR